MEILRHYYGDDIELVVNAPIQDITQSYPGSPLRLGSVGEEVAVVQTSLNRISQNYPAIPKIQPVTASSGEDTEYSVRQFQRIFNLASDGVVGKATGISWSTSMWASPGSLSWSAKICSSA